MTLTVNLFDICVAWYIVPDDSVLDIANKESKYYRYHHDAEYHAEVYRAAEIVGGLIGITLGCHSRNLHLL